MIDLGTLGGRSSFAAAVNGRGQVIGDSDTGTGSTGTGEGHAFLWQNGSMTDLGTLGFGTNFLGQVVGVGERNCRRREHPRSTSAARLAAGARPRPARHTRSCGRTDA
jgi:probable HAF family extracellular repeat protein